MELNMTSNLPQRGDSNLPWLRQCKQQFIYLFWQDFRQNLVFFNIFENHA